MSSNKKWALERSQNVEIFGRPPENDKRIYGRSLRSKLEAEKTCDYLQVCIWVIPKMEFLI